MLGLTGPLLRPVLAVGPLSRLRVLAHPLVALPLWAVSLYAWHLPRLYEAAVENEFVHALEHLCFFGTGVLMWAAVIEVLPGPEWFGTGAKFGYVAVVRLLETILGNVFIWSGYVIYDVYDHGEEHSVWERSRTRPRGHDHDGRGLACDDRAPSPGCS